MTHITIQDPNRLIIPKHTTLIGRRVYCKGVSCEVNLTGYKYRFVLEDGSVLYNCDNWCPRQTRHIEWGPRQVTSSEQKTTIFDITKIVG